MPRPTIPDEIRELRKFYRPHNPNLPKGRKKYWTENRMNALADLMMDWFEANDTKITLGSFCWEHKIPPGYISTFAKKSEYFGYCVSVIKALLETRLLEMGLAGEIDKVMAIFSLKNIAGWTDKKEISSTLEVTSTIVELQLPKKKEVKADYEVLGNG